MTHDSRLLMTLCAALVWGVSSTPSVATAQSARPVTLEGLCTPLSIASLENDAIDIPLTYTGDSVIRSVTVELQWEAATNEEVVIGLEGPADNAAALAVGAVGAGASVTFADDAGTGATLSADGRLISRIAPDESLSVFNGADPSGPWRLIALNLQEPDELRITGCTLHVTVDGVTGPEDPVETTTTTLPDASPTSDTPTSTQPTSVSSFPAPVGPASSTAHALTPGTDTDPNKSEPQEHGDSRQQASGVLARTGYWLWGPPGITGLALFAVGLVVLLARRYLVAGDSNAH